MLVSMPVNANTPLSDLEVLLALANTGHDGVDELADVTSTQEWWRGLHPDHAAWPGSPGTAEDLAVLRAAREVVRAAGLRNNGLAAPVEFGSLPVPLQFTWDDGPSLRPADAASIPVEVAARVVLGLVRSSARPDWGRLKACPGPDCGWMFLDRSRNGSRRWCQMSACGNRAKGAAFRARHRVATVG